MATKKDTEFKSVKVTYRDTDNDNGTIRVATNNIVIDGKLTLKQYRIKVDEEVSLPVTVIKMLKDRYEIRKDKKDKRVKVKTIVVEEV